MDNNWKTWQGIEYTERPIQPVFQYERDRTTGQRLFLVHWADVDAFVQKILTGVTGGIPWYTLPAEFPGHTELIARTARVNGIGAFDDSGTESVINYTLAEILVGYETRQWTSGFQTPLDPQVIQTESVDLTADVLQMPKGFFRWNNDNEIIEEPQGLLIPGMEITIDKEYVPILNVGTILSVCGKMNDAISQGVPTHKLLYLGAAAHRSVSVNGYGPWRVSHKLKARDQEFTKLPRRVAGQTTVQWQEVKPWPFPETDFSVLDAT